MKKILFFVLFLLLISISSTPTQVSNCNFPCYWDNDTGDCYSDAGGMRCIEVMIPDPYTVFTPCRCCVVVKPPLGSK